MSDETTTEMLAEIEGQAADYPPPEGWRWLQIGEVIRTGDRWVRLVDGQLFDAYPNGQCVRHRRFIRRIEPEPEQTITPDDVAAEALAGVWDQAKAEQEIAELQAQVRFLKNRELTLGTRLEEEKAVTTKRLQQVEELRSEVSHVQRLWGESRRRVEELETLVADLRAVNAATEKAVNSAARDKADLQHRLDVVSSEWAVQAETIRGLQTQLEAVKAELVRQCENSRLLQIELDAREQVPQAVSDRFEEGWDAGTARAVEAIAEWTEPFRQMIEKADNLVESDRARRLCAEIMQSLPAIMRSLTGLTDED